MSPSGPGAGTLTGMSTPADSGPIDSPDPSVAEHVRRYIATGGASGYLEGGTTNLVLTHRGRTSGRLYRTGLFFGTVAALAGIIPFTVVRTDSVLPGQGLGIWLAVVSVAAAATLGTSLVTARRVLRTPAVAAVAVAA